jgi:cytochrome c-type biogenesis protein CcmH
MRRSRILAAVAAFTLFCNALAFAVQPDEVLPDPSLEARARVLSRELRCMVCQNQSIDDSDAPLARDLRLLVRERLRAGDSDGAVIDYLVARYGEFVLLKPRIAWHTAALWAVPSLVLLAGLVAVLAAWRRRGTPAGLRPLAAEEEQRLKDLIEDR